MLIIFIIFHIVVALSGDTEGDMKDAINQAYNWIESVSNNGEFTEANTHQNQYDLYSGSSGVLVYTLELYDYTKDEGVLNLTKVIAENLLKQYDSEIRSKFDLSFFHKGLAGIAFSFHVLYDFIPNEEYKEFANSIDQVILTRFSTEKMPNCLRWGYAGTALYLMWLYDRTTDPTMKKSIMGNITAGVELMLKNAVEEKKCDGLKWFYEGKMGPELPGYADGTAGIAYCLARLYEETGNTDYLTYAEKGMNYLKSIANFEDNGCLIFHSNMPLDTAKYYLEECNGNAGHIKAFLKMYNVTQNQEYLDLAVKSGNSLLKYYPTYNWWLPTNKKHFWFWSTMSLCDGSVGVIEALNVLRKYTKSKDYDKPIEDIVSNIISRKTMKGNDMCYWTQAENRDQPKKTWDQVGMYQGAGGITMTFIHLLSESSRIKLPDYLF